MLTASVHEICSVLLRCNCIQTWSIFLVRGTQATAARSIAGYEYFDVKFYIIDSRLQEILPAVVVTRLRKVPFNGEGRTQLRSQHGCKQILKLTDTHTYTFSAVDCQWISTLEKLSRVSCIFEQPMNSNYQLCRRLGSAMVVEKALAC